VKNRQFHDHENGGTKDNPQQGRGIFRVPRSQSAQEPNQECQSDGDEQNMDAQSLALEQRLPEGVRFAAQ
jgi:hypothetical protein